MLWLRKYPNMGSWYRMVEQMSRRNRAQWVTSTARTNTTNPNMDATENAAPGSFPGPLFLLSIVILINY